MAAVLLKQESDTKSQNSKNKDFYVATAYE